MPDAQPDTERLRILLTVHHRLERGAGAPGATLALADALERRGHRVEVVGFGLVGTSRGATLDAVRFPHAVARLVRRRFELGDLDVVDASSGDLAYVAPLRVRAASTAVFTRSHGLEHLADAARRRGAAAGELDLRHRYSLYHGGWRLREVARSFRAADGALLLNDAEVTFATEVLGVPTERVWRTSSPVRDAFIDLPRAPQRDVLVLGPASWRKGGDVSVRVVETVLRADPFATASWAGLDDPGATAEAFGDDVRARLAVSGRYGVDEEAQLLATHRVLLFASRFEGLPLTLLEAMVAGIAVVGTDIPGVRDLLGDGAGVLAPEGHVEGLAGAVRSLLADEARRETCGASAVKAAAAHGTESVVDGVLEAYWTVLEVKRPMR
jgi:glycosyltransferase involved in cell wall biosynthesis